ncbi:Plasma-membrane choline transporter [Musa troglodytarum]|uniref:Choline transporter-like protein n=1 Tax=Musa troglodytarum TaxID=320322 RepID=A0A9E7EJX4_9LILI|nr:Plasma-membrane choline transporter [Musa troglodytarum]
MTGVGYDVGVELALDHKHSPFLKDTVDPSCCHILEAHLHLLDGYSCRLLLLLYYRMVPPLWRQDEKGMTRAHDGRWVQRNRQEVIDDHTHHHLHRMGCSAMAVMEGEAGDKEEKLDMEGRPDGGDEKKEVAAVVESSRSETRVSRLQTQHPVAPVQVAPHGAATPPATVAAANQPTPTPQVELASLNSREYTNRVSLLLFILHLLVAAAAVCFFCFKAIQGLVDSDSGKARNGRRVLKFWLPPIEGASVLSIGLAFAWQKAVRSWPSVMVPFILWACFFATMAAGILLLCFSLPATDGLGVAFMTFSIGAGLYACWVTRRIAFTGKVFAQALRPVTKFQDVNGPAYLMMGVGFLWISAWCFAVIGALNFYYPTLTILALVLSLAWTAEVMRNVANLTVSRVIALYYLRGMQSSTQFSFQRATTINLGSACLGSLFVPTIEALRIMARGLNLLEGEDEFLFSCAHCCLRVMESIFRYGNSWAFVHIAAYGRGFVEASQSTWGLFEKQRMEAVVDSDITSAVCFLTGVTSGALSLIFAASWTFSSHKHYTATVSLLAFFVGYLMTRIAMALPHGCVACYYVCYAENPGSRLFDSTIPDRLNQIGSGREGFVPTPRFPRPNFRT